jgi:hypothetical protein
MDAYLSGEARQSLEALCLIHPSSIPDGLLIGHKRGQRFFVERIVSSMKGFFPSLKKYNEMDKLFDGKLIGFYSYSIDENKMKKILAPFAFGKLFLEISLNPQKKMTIQSFVIDHEKKFILLPVKLNVSKQKRT